MITCPFTRIRLWVSTDLCPPEHLVTTDKMSLIIAEDCTPWGTFNQEINRVPAKLRVAYAPTGTECPRPKEVFCQQPSDSHQIQNSNQLPQPACQGQHISHTLIQRAFLLNSWWECWMPPRATSKLLFLLENRSPFVLVKHQLLCSLSHANQPKIGQATAHSGFTTSLKEGKKEDNGGGRRRKERGERREERWAAEANPWGSSIPSALCSDKALLRQLLCIICAAAHKRWFCHYPKINK